MEAFSGVNCPSLSEAECERDNSMCFYRQTGSPKCVTAIPDNCPGMNREHCESLKAQALCHYDFPKAEKDGKDWKSACFPGPAPGLAQEDPPCVLRKAEGEC